MKQVAKTPTTPQVRPRQTKETIQDVGATLRKIKLKPPTAADSNVERAKTRIQALPSPTVVAKSQTMIVMMFSMK